MHNMARCKLMGTCLWSCFGDFGRKSRLGSGILGQVFGDLLGIRNAVRGYQRERVCRGKHRHFGWYNDVLKRVCGGSLEIRKAVCRCWFRCVSKVVKRRRLWWYEVVLKFSSGWT